MLVDLKKSLLDGQLISFAKENDIKWQVYENTTYLWLLMNNTVQSVMCKASPELLTLPHQQPLTGIIEQLTHNATILECGLGGGANARFIQHKLPQSNINVIEQSQLVIDWFNYFFNPNKIQLNLIHARAENFIQSTEQQYDLIITDLFNASASILDILNFEYFTALKRSLKPNGFAYVNFLPETQFEPELIKAYLRETGLEICWAEKIIGFRNWVFILKN